MNTPNVKKPIRIIAIGISRKGEPFEITAVNDEAIGIRAAVAGITADKLTLSQLAGHAAAMEATHDDIHGFAAMLDALRTGEVESLAPMSEATLDAIEEEWVGREFSESAGKPQ